eukprot:5061990-Prymnesium_polylepis.1
MYSAYEARANSEANDHAGLAEVSRSAPRPSPAPNARKARLARLSSAARGARGVCGGRGWKGPAVGQPPCTSTVHPIDPCVRPPRIHD